MKPHYGISSWALNFLPSTSTSFRLEQGEIRVNDAPCPRARANLEARRERGTWKLSILSFHQLFHVLLRLLSSNLPQSEISAEAIFTALDFRHRRPPRSDVARVPGVIVALALTSELPGATAGHPLATDIHE